MLLTWLYLSLGAGRLGEIYFRTVGEAERSGGSRRFLSVDEASDTQQEEQPHQRDAGRHWIRQEQSATGPAHRPENQTRYIPLLHLLTLIHLFFIWFIELTSLKWKMNLS